jgi:hypothetical protein
MARSRDDRVKDDLGFATARYWLRDFLEEVAHGSDRPASLLEQFSADPPEG